MIPLELTRPWMLLLALPLAGIVVTFYVRSLSDFPARQRVVSMVSRLLILGLIVLALGWAHVASSNERPFCYLSW